VPVDVGLSDVSSRAVGDLSYRRTADDLALVGALGKVGILGAVVVRSAATWAFARGLALILERIVWTWKWKMAC